MKDKEPILPDLRIAEVIASTEMLEKEIYQIDREREVYYCASCLAMFEDKCCCDEFYED